LAWFWLLRPGFRLQLRVFGSYSKFWFSASIFSSWPLSLRFCFGFSAGCSAALDFPVLVCRFFRAADLLTCFRFTKPAFDSAARSPLLYLQRCRLESLSHSVLPASPRRAPGFRLPLEFLYPAPSAPVRGTVSRPHFCLGSRLESRCQERPARHQIRSAACLSLDLIFSLRSGFGYRRTALWFRFFPLL
jgi:hypothetical protein